ncbi:DUF6545 domain-containing protein [Streptomyces sp. M10(2022)]
MTIRPDGVSSALDSWLGIHNVTTLCKHLAGITAAYAVLTFVYDVAQEQATALRGSRPRIAVPLAAGVGLTLLFFAAPQPGKPPTFSPTSPTTGVSPSTASSGPATSVRLSSVPLDCAGDGVASRSRPPGARASDHRHGDSSGDRLRGAPRTGLGASLPRLDAAIPRTDENVSSALLFAALVFILAGSTLPVVRRLHQWGRAHLALTRLYPLWLELTAAVPSVRLDPPRSRRADALLFRHTRGRLYRRG